MVTFQTARWLIFLALAALLLAGVQISGCSTPTRAKVVSLEKRVTGAQTGNRSSYHRVRRGDTLYTIAWRYGVDFQELAGWNGISPPYTIYPGQSLRLSYPVTRVAPDTPGQEHKKASSGSSATTAKTAPEAKVAARRSSDNKGNLTGQKQKVVDSNLLERTNLVWQWPTNGRLEQRFSNVDPSRKGIKISGSSGQRVVAAESGKVVYAGSGLIGYGRLIIIKHNKNYLSAYGHNRKLLVNEGEVVKKGQQLAEMGKNGAGKPTLHFEIRRNGTPVNPLKFLPRRR